MYRGLIHTFQSFLFSHIVAPQRISSSNYYTSPYIGPLVTVPQKLASSTTRDKFTANSFLFFTCLCINFMCYYIINFPWIYLNCKVLWHFTLEIHQDLNRTNPQNFHLQNSHNPDPHWMILGSRG